MYSIDTVILPFYEEGSMNHVHAPPVIDRNEKMLTAQADPDIVNRHAGDDHPLDYGGTTSTKHNI